MMWPALGRLRSTPGAITGQSGAAAHDVQRGAFALPNSEAIFGSQLALLAARVLGAWKWVERKRTQQLAGRRLRVAETVSLGEKRFVSLIQVDGAQFLIGGAAGSLSLLAVLDPKAEARATIPGESCNGETQA